MRHFDLVHWTDFVRGVTEAADRRAMEEHLASGCAHCTDAVALLTKVVAATCADAQYRVPEAWVQRAKAIVAPRAVPSLADLPRMVARLIYDSFRDPLPVGIRTSQRASRQVLYEAGDYCVDLRLESEPGQPRFSLVGQIANRKAPNQPMAGIPVLLLCGGDVVTSDQSNAFGEFHLESHYQSGLRLCMPIVPLGQRIELSLRPLLSEQDGWNPGEGGLV